MTVLFSPATGGIGALNGLLAGGFFQSMEESSRWGGHWRVDCSSDWRFLDSKRRVSGSILPPTGGFLPLGWWLVSGFFHRLGDFVRWDSVLCGFHRLIGFVPIGFVVVGLILVFDQGGNDVSNGC